MKFLALSALFALVLCGQTPPPSGVAPGTPAPPQPAAPQPETTAPAAPITPETVVAEADGKKLTAAEIDQLFATLPAQYQQSARLQPDRALTQLLMFNIWLRKPKRLTSTSVPRGKIPSSSSAWTILYQAEINDYKDKIQITPEDQDKLYKEHPERFKQANVRVIHVSFSATPDKPGPDGKKMMSDAEAKAKIDDLRKQILAGGDFGKLARENSDDKTSAAKDGDFGTISHNSPYPEPVKTAVFALKAGDISEPVKQANGYYLIKVESSVTQPIGEVRAQIIEELKQARFTEWMKGLQTRFAVKVENPAYFAPRRPPQLQTVR